MTRPLIARLLPGEEYTEFVIDSRKYRLTRDGLVWECRNPYENTPGSPDDYSGDMEDEGAVAGQGGPISETEGTHLVLRRRQGESIVIDGTVEVFVQETGTPRDSVVVDPVDTG